MPNDFLSKYIGYLCFSSQNERYNIAPTPLSPEVIFWSSDKQIMHRKI